MKAGAIADSEQSLRLALLSMRRSWEPAGPEVARLLSDLAAVDYLHHTKMPTRNHFLNAPWTCGIKQE